VRLTGGAGQQPSARQRSRQPFSGGQAGERAGLGETIGGSFRLSQASRRRGDWRGDQDRLPAWLHRPQRTASQGQPRFLQPLLDSINGTVAGRTIQVVTADTQAKPDVALTKAKQLVENEKVDLLAGFNLSTECFAVAPYAGQAKIPMVVTDNCAAVRLMTDPKLTSPYLVRTSTNGSGVQALADYAYKQGLRKAIMVSIDNSGIQESADSFAKVFVDRGGSFVQELHPSFGTTDFGPIVSQLDQSADSVVLFEPGIDGLRFGQAYASYGLKKFKVIDAIGGPTNGSNLTQLGDKLLGVWGQSPFPPALDTTIDQQWLKGWQAKYGDRAIGSSDATNGYAGAMIITSAIKALDGKVDDRQAFMNTLYKLDLETNKGRMKLDANHDVVQNAYVFDVVQNGAIVQLHSLYTQELVAADSFNTPQELAKFPFGQLKGKWVGMSKDGLAALSK
jgi:branched-chain amino acid transport system substrate-binding protein